jgi:dienelactone hydrolase
VQLPNQLGSAVIYGNDSIKNQGTGATTLKAKILVTHGGADLDFRVYPGVKHSFTVPQATSKGEAFGMPFKYDEHADKDSWAALLRMLE